MNTQVIPLSITLAFAIASPTFASSAVDLTVRGAITPNACESLLSGGGVVDFGKMSAGDLNADQFSTLPEQALTLSVRCEGPTLFILSTIDNRAGSSAMHRSWHGLGMTAENEKLGGSRFDLLTPIADGLQVRTITSLDGTTWVPSTALNPYLLTAIAAANGIDVPIAVKTFDAQIKLETHIAPGGDLTLIDEIPIDGSATLQLKYL
ncbi:DUF1120 domain-containing protein [Pseudomonas poae]|uniref:DUF1120 domain-containing protein n=1 Tax=Pseudomonas poae TaxID=200451 RepID=A0A2S9EVV6_9PSED|nr:DUF1120 domain-containing protein [Pseudomonas poae]PRA28749.1 hypothetical protein CQZ97_14040 [Pseudomonas poae]PRC20446.1 hypothetical protein CQZ99_07285 [Pseudomonas poae]